MNVDTWEEDVGMKRKSTPRMACEDGIDIALNNKVSEYIALNGTNGLVKLTDLIKFLYPNYKQKAYFKLDFLTYKTRIYSTKVGNYNYIGIIQRRTK